MALRVEKGIDKSDNPISNKNETLFHELRERGYYVQKIGQEDDTRYIVVSCEPPSQPKNPTCGLWD